MHNKKLIISSDVKAKITDFISKQVSKFKVEYKKKQKVEEDAEAARRLLDFHNIGSGSDMRRDMGKSSEEQDDDFFDEY